MSQPPSATALSALLAALPVSRLAELVQVLANGSVPESTAAVEFEAPATPAPTRRKVGWSRGRKRRPHKATRAKATRAKAADTDDKKATRRARQAERTRERQAAARAAREAAHEAEATHAAGDASNGTGGHDKGDVGPAVAAAPVNKVTRAVLAKSLWGPAEALQPATPWRAVAEEFNINTAICIDAHRARTLPPGVGADAVARFLELPTS